MHLDARVVWAVGPSPTFYLRRGLAFGDDGAHGCRALRHDAGMTRVDEDPQLEDGATMAGDASVAEVEPE
jgi:hypothetical protein